MRGLPSYQSLALFSILMLTASCATYYQSNSGFNQEFEQGNLDNALSNLQADGKEAKGKREFLFYVNNGLVLSMMGRYTESNEYFEKAYLFGEDYRKNYLNEAASYLTNPMITAYRGEDHEHLMLLYYKALNFLKMGKTNEALVECRRLNIRLQQLSDRYENENKFQRDAFIHTLMGIIYEADKDYNNAFIAYRNSLEIYETDYDQLFNLSIPEQLKQDLLRTAWRSGLTDEFTYYKDKFGLPDFTVEPSTGGEVVFFWHNGLSPIKTEWSLNFAIDRRGDMVYFYNRELGISFPFSLEGYDDREKNGLTQMEFFRVALPRYIERPTYYQDATLQVAEHAYPLYLLEDVNKIAFKSLQQRMTLELSKALLRVALKKAMEHQIKQEDKTLGSVLGMINVLTEKADTRNWQTLPHSIYYSRIPLPEGESTVTLQLRDPGNTLQEYQFTYSVKPGQILFHTFSSLESRYVGSGY